MDVFNLRKKITVATIIALAAFVAFAMRADGAGRKPEGFGEFVYSGYKPLSDKPINVYYYIPADAAADAPVMILMHGNSRAAKSYRDAMAKYAERDKFLLFVPEFSKKQFPGSRDYHQGGVFDKKGKLKKREDWTFSIIEPLFDHIRRLTGNKSQGYILYGFSAGSQFVHRFNWFCPDNRAVKTISSSAGSYTMADYQIPYLYGLGKTKIPESNLATAFSKDFIVVVGDADTVLSRPDLPKSAGANRQGRDRVERARNFYLESKKLAEKKGIPFNWKFRTVSGVGHSQGQMAGPVADLLSGKPDAVSNTRDLLEEIEMIRTGNHIPGMQVVHTKGGRTQIYSLGTKNADTDDAVTSHTLFQCASLSKTVMAYAVLRLYNKGVISLDIPLETYLKYPRLSEEPEGNKITARMVLSHTSGLPNWSKPRGSKLTVAFKPGKGYRYSGEGYLFLQKVVEHLTQKTLEQIAEEEVFEPLGMKESSYVYRSSMRENYSNGHTDEKPVAIRKFTEANGAFSLITTAVDYSTFVQKALLEGEGLQPETHSMMLDSLVDKKKNLKNGLGVMMQYNERGKGIYHTGSNPGFRSFFFAYPATGESIVCFTNSTNGAKIRKELATLILDKQTFWSF